MELHHLKGEGSNSLAGLKREQVQAELDRLLEVDQRLKPAWADASRVAGYGECAGVLAVEADVVTCDLKNCRSDEVGEGARTESEASSIGAEPVLVVSVSAEFQERHQEPLPLERSAWTTRVAYSARSRRSRWTRDSSGHQEA